MKFILQHDDLDKKSKDCLILGIFENNELTPTAQKIDKKSGGFFSNLLKAGDITGKMGQTHWFYHVPHLTAERVLLVGCGKNKPLNDRDFRKIIASSAKALSTSKTKTALSHLTELIVTDRNTPWKIKHAVETTAGNLYVFDQFKSEKTPKCMLREMAFAIPHDETLTLCNTALKQALAMVKGIERTKNIANLPSNICNPIYFAKEARALAKEYKSISVKVLDVKQMEKLGMGAFLAVAKGSHQEAQLICLEYKGTPKKTAPIALVGKGITFDTGGISLKPADSMIGMKYDMCGAATVLGTLTAVAELKLPIHLVGVLAMAENMPSGTACKPEDIVTTLSGQTVEILNTDAEGRLVLCDALTYCERYKPEIVIDIATLTGAVVIALGHHATGLLSNNDELARDLLAAGNESFDRAWQLPLWEDYQDQLKSPFADMTNVGGRIGGTITAACFLSRFAKKFKWAHLDVAGTAAMMMGGSERYATGRPVPMLVQYLIDKCSK